MKTASMSAAITTGSRAHTKVPIRFGSTYKLKADAPDDAIETLSKTTIVPLLEKLLADGSIVEYDIDTQALHTQAPGLFFIYITAPNAEGLDKFRAGAARSHQSQPPLRSGLRCCD